MANSNSIQSLQDEGDQFEKLICNRMEDLHAVLCPYAEVWNKHIRPRRLGSGSALEHAWMPFGGSHYTALIRLHHADEAKQEVLNLCHELQETVDRELGSNDYAKLLRLHAVCAALWENLGAAIDNFRRAKFEAEKLFGIKFDAVSETCQKCERPLVNQYKTTGGPLNDAVNPWLYYAYQRRTQFIHSRIVPTQIVDGMVVFNCLHFEDETTEWPAHDVKPEQLDQEIVKSWDKIIEELSSEWWTLLSLLGKQDPGPEKEWKALDMQTPSLSTTDASMVDRLINCSTSGNFNFQP